MTCDNQLAASGSVSTLDFVNNHDVVNEHSQEVFLAAGDIGAGAEAVAEVAFEHAVDRFHLGTLAVGFVFLRPGEEPLHHPAEVSGGWLVGGSSGTGFDQRPNAKFVSRQSMIGFRIVTCIGQDEANPSTLTCASDQRPEVATVRAHAGSRTRTENEMAGGIDADAELGRTLCRPRPA